MIGAVAAIEAISTQGVVPVRNPVQVAGTQMSFDEMLKAGIQATDTKVAEADRLVQAFALDDSIPAHQVTFALEEARLSLELMLQVRNRLLEGYQQIMNMQV